MDTLRREIFAWIYFREWFFFTFRVDLFREFGQNPRKSRKFVPQMISLLKVSKTIAKGQNSKPPQNKTKRDEISFSSGETYGRGDDVAKLLLRARNAPKKLIKVTPSASFHVCYWKLWLTLYKSWIIPMAIAYQIK